MLKRSCPKPSQRGNGGSVVRRDFASIAAT
jgi:hypothetical protein